MSKSPAGTPQVKLSNGRIQIVLTYGGKRKYLSLGLSESKQNRDYADMVRSWIQNDLRCNNFDPSRFPDLTLDGAVAVRDYLNLKTTPNILPSGF